MKKKNRFLTHLSNYWIFHVLWIIFCVSAVMFEFNILTKPKANEKIDFFIGANVKDESEFTQYLSNNKPEYLRKLSHRFVNPDSTLFNQTFYTYGTVDADLFILSESFLKTVNTKEYFFPLYEDKCKTVFEKDLEYYKAEDEMYYGIKVNSPFLIETSDNMYILFSKNTLHLGELNNTSLDGCVNITKLFI